MTSTTTAIDRLVEAINSHDLDAIEACFAPNYSVTTPAHPATTPAHPARSFTGRENVRRNWERILAAHPTVQAKAEPQVHSGNEIWAEWEYTSETGEHGQFWFRGVAITVISGNVIESARFYMEPVDTEAGPMRE